MTPMTKSARRRWLESLPVADRKRESEIAKENAERIRQATRKGDDRDNS